MVHFKPIPIKDLLETVTGEVVAGARHDGSLSDVVVRTLVEPGSSSEADSAVAFFISESFVRYWNECKVQVAVVSKTLWPKLEALGIPDGRVVVLSPDAYLGLARLSKVVVDRNPELDWGSNLPVAGSNKRPASTVVDPTAQVSESAALGENVRIGARSKIHAGVVLANGVTVGADSELFPNVVVYPRCEIGSRVRLHSGVVIGADGFGYARGPKGSEKIYHLGRVIIGDDVEFGAMSAIDRGTIRDSVVEQGAKVDNLVQVGHNGHLKAHSILCAQVGLAGNVTIGRGAILAGKAGVADKLEIGDGAIIGPMTGVSKDVEPGKVFMGQHIAREKKQWWRLLAYFDRLPELFERVKKLEKTHER